MDLLININATFDYPVVEPPPAPPPAPPPVSITYKLPDGDFWRLRTDDESGTALRNNLPATVESLEGIFIPMPKAYQLWLFEIWKVFGAPMTLADLKNKWYSFWKSDRAFTNHGHGSDELADYVNSANMDRPPMARQMLTTVNNIVKQVDTVSYLGMDWIVCEALTIYDMPTLDVLRLKPWLLHYCTTSQSQVFNGKHGVGRFPQLNGNDVPLPLLSRNGRITFRKSYLEKLPPNSELPNPYIPEYRYSPQLYPRVNAV